MDIRRTVRRWIAGPLGLALGAAVGLGAVTMAPRTYEARTDVLLTPTADVRASDALHDRLLGSYALMLDSRTVAEAVHGRAGVTASATSIDAGLSGSVVDGTSILRATVHDDDPDTAAALSDAAAASLVDLMADRGIAATTNAEDADTTPAAADTAPTWSVRASIVEDATVPGQASSPAAPEWIAVGALAGLLLALVGATVTRSAPSGRARRSTGHRSAAGTQPGRHRGR